MHRVRIIILFLVSLLVVSGCKVTPRAGVGKEGENAALIDIDATGSNDLEDAATAMDEGDYELALGLFRDILADNPTVTTAYLGIGEIFMIKEDFQKAEPAYRRAARLEPRNFDAQYGHGRALQMLTRFVEAVGAYLRALDINPDSADANLNLATTYLRLDQAEDALIHAQKVVELDPENGAARVNLGAVYEHLGMNEKAIDEWLTALELVDDTPPVLMNLIKVLAKEKRYQEAVNTALNLIRIQPSPNAYERLGWAYFRLGEYDKSIDAYREAVALDPNHWPSHNGIGVNALNRWLVSKKTDEDAKREARDAFRQSLRINRDQQRLIKLMLRYEL